MTVQGSRRATAQAGWRTNRLYWPVSDDDRESLVTDESPFKGKTGLRRVWNAFHYSRAGLRAAYNAEDAFRQELFLTAVLVPLALLLSPNGAGLALMIGSLLLVLIVELLNSAIEAVVDRVSLEQHPLAKRAKDIGSAAVLLALLNVGVVWACVLFG